MDHQDSTSLRVISVSAVVVRRPDGSVVTVRKKGTDRFMLPGGKWEPGEAPLDCAVRELDEELGVPLAPERLTPLGRFDTAAANEPGFRLVSEVFTVETDLPVEPRAEIAEARWLTPTELRTVAVLREDECAPWAPLLVRVVREGLWWGRGSESDDRDEREEQ
ncbi:MULTISPECIES: NUDIX domain-containing protein [unclassified Dietzia]|uniref:NUDIX hydrolase n=1 Tax=unclassified Dietzia TaxID=2617939 RepID=UPI001E2DD227|nr:MULTISPECIES: NUDIX domain-containing protein [unclassified Dietzia]